MSAINNASALQSRSWPHALSPSDQVRASEGAKPAPAPTLFTQCRDIALAALPLITLNDSLRQMLPLAASGVRTLSSIETIDSSRNDSQLVWGMVHTAISVASFTASLFAHPAALLLTTGQDLLLNAGHFVQALNENDYQKAMSVCAQSAASCLYFGMFVTGSVQLGLLATGVQVLVSACRSFSDLQEGNLLAAIGQAAMAALRITGINNNQMHAIATNIDNQFLNVNIFPPAKIKEPKKDPTRSIDPAEPEPLSFDDDLNLHTVAEIKKMRSVLLLAKLAEEDFRANNLYHRPAPVLSRTTNPASPLEALDRVLSEHDGFCLGENHNEEAAKTLLKDHMSFLKAKGVTCMFVEGAYLKDWDRIERFNAGLTDDVSWAYPNDAETLLVARQHGIRIFPIDCSRSSSHSYYRLLNLNYATLLTIREELQRNPGLGKYIVWVGNRHTNSISFSRGKVPGISELMNIPSLIAQDAPFYGPPRFRANCSHPGIPGATANIVVDIA